SHRLKQGVEVRRELGELAPLTCYAGQINQVLMNLIANACDAVTSAKDRTGGRITIRSGLDRTRELTWFEVEDDGPGIPRAQIERIFDPFFTTKDVGQGTGLGLAITHSIVERHGGHISVASEPGRGATFRVEIPDHIETRGQPEAERVPLEGVG
ncbi:MAG: histidine kinase, partial [Candidatus Eremiobacteraeota bacterium]|nr:histidine kinase [Candidatus Eremiobacteraeota bacterium]